MKAVVAVALLLVAGCVSWFDPLTGEKKTKLDPNNPALKAAEGIGDAAVTLLPLLGAAGAGAGSVLASVLAVWRKKVKPSLEKERTEAQHAGAASQAIVDALEAFKKEQPEAWQSVGGKINEQLKYQGVDPLVLENVIRGLRGLKPREA